MGNQPAFFTYLDAEQLDALEEFARQPGRTIQQCRDYLVAELGFVFAEDFPTHPKRISKSAMGRWKQDLDERLIAERSAASGRLAKAIEKSLRDTGGAAVHEATTMLLGQLISDAAQAADPKEISTKDIANLSLAAQRVTLAQLRNEDVKARYEDRQRRAAAEVKTMAKNGASGSQIADKLGELLGLPPEEPDAGTDGEGAAA